MSFHEVRFPEDISYGAVGGPKFKTTVLELSSGHEKRNINWSEAKAEYDVSHGLRRLADIRTILAFFYARYGRAYGFRFKDWVDYELDRQTIGTGTGAQAQFQITKTYTSGSYSYVRQVKKIVADTVRAWVNDVELEEGPGAGQFQVNYNTGVVVFGTNPAMGHVVEVQCEFDVPVRFDTDISNMTYEMFQTVGWNSILLVEVRV